MSQSREKNNKITYFPGQFNVVNAFYGGKLKGYQHLYEETNQDQDILVLNIGLHTTCEDSKIGESGCL